MDALGNFLVVLLIVGGSGAGISAVNPSFDNNYRVIWGNEHVVPGRRTIVQLYMDQAHGGAGFESKLTYGSGHFQMRIKLPGKESAGVVTAFYLTSGNHAGHDELDFEFLGNRAGKPYTLQTNVFVNGEGNREQRIHLWFDPTAHFHTYKILWNDHHIAFFVDNIPIREFKNNRRYGISYPSQRMSIEASLWDGDNWATDGGKTKTNWTFAPFRAYFDEFNIDGCSNNLGGRDDPCNAANYWWNKERYWELDPSEKRSYKIVKDNYLNYDYCTDRSRHPVTPPECSYNEPS